MKKRIVLIRQLYLRLQRQIKPSIQKFLKYIYQPGFLRAAVTSIFILVFIWWMAPYIAFAGYAPFVSFPLKIIITLLVIFFWFFRGLPYALLYYRHLQNAFQAFQKKTVLHTKEKRVLRHFSILVSRCLSSLSKGKYPFLLQDRRPWILVLGPRGVGKSQLLKKNRFGLKKSAFSQIALSIWQNKESVFFELSSNYAENDHTLLKLQWKRFLSLIRRYHGESFLSGIMVVMDVASLEKINRGEGNDFIAAMSARLNEVQQFRYFVPVTITLAKCDLLEGFVPFFSELTRDERQQLLGIELTGACASYLIQDRFIEQYANFMQTMNSRLIWLFHHEPNLQKRQRMQRLIVELETIEFILEKFFISMKWDNDLSVRGIFFTSSEQKAKEQLISLIQPQGALEHFFKRTQGQQVSESQTFFSDCLLGYVAVFWHRDYQYQASAFHRRVVFFAGALLCVVLLVFACQVEYKQVKTKLVAINTMLRSKPVQQITTSSTWQDQLNALYDINTNIRSEAKFQFRWFEWMELFPIAHKARKLYESGLEQLFIPELEKTIFLTMQQAIRTKSIDLYFALKVYLMLTNVHHLNDAFVHQWFFSVWSEQYRSEFTQQNNLLKHLKYLLQSDLLPLSVSQPVVDKIRQTLMELPRANLAFAVLTDHYGKETVLLFKGQKNIAGFELSHLSIPAFYNPKQFKTIYNQVIPDFLQKGHIENWVTGKNSTSEISNTELSRLTNGVRSLYLKSYARNWLNMLNQISFKPATSLKDLSSTINLFRNNNSPFWQFIRVVLFNAMLSGNSSEVLGEPFNSLYIQLSSLAEENASYQKMQATLNAFSRYLSIIINASDLKKTAYQSALQRMQANQTDDVLTKMSKGMTDLPLSFQRIFHQFSIQAWQIILNQASQYLDHQWKALVWKPYEETLDNRYPLFVNSKSDASFEAFQTFFSPEGIMNDFFMYYIKPFVDTRKNYWIWQTLDGLSLPIPQATLDIFIRASLIEKMFFAEGTDQMSFKFSILPLELSSTIEQCIINIDDQMMTINPNNLVTHLFTWPSKQQQGVDVTFKSKSGHEDLLTQKGSWAWFRLLNAADFKTTENPRKYRVTFQKGQYFINLELTTPNLINPYVPNILQAFRCPASLLQKS